MGLVRCERSVPPEAQVVCGCVHQARQDYQLGPHEFNWTIMDLDDDPVRPLYHKKVQGHSFCGGPPNTGHQRARGQGTSCLGSGPHKHQHR